MIVKRVYTLLTTGAIVLSAWMTPATAAGAGAVTVPLHRTAAHGTLINKHVTHTAHVAPPTAARTTAVKKPAVVHAKPAAHPRVTRARRVAHAHHGNHRAGGVGGHVRSTGGEPVAGAAVSIARSGHGHRGRNRHIHAGHSTVTDSSGHFVMRGIRAGSHRVVASKSGVGKGGKAVHIRGGVVRTGMEIKLASASHKHKKHHKHK
jgi:hypothetical protein